MVIKDLIDVVQTKARTNKGQAEETINAIFSTMAEALASGEEVKINGFGTFSVKPTKARKGVNPATGQEIEIPASKKLVFKASKTLKGFIKEEGTSSDEDEE